MSLRIAFSLATLGHGGIGRMHLNLIGALCDRGVAVDVLLGKSEGPYTERVDQRARVITLGCSHVLWSALPVARYLAGEHPQVMVTDKLRVNIAALRARRLAHSRAAIFTSVHGVVSHKLHNQHLSRRKSRRKERAARRFYPQNDGLICFDLSTIDTTFGSTPLRSSLKIG